MTVEFDCEGCGRHIYVLAGEAGPLCAACITMPGWVDDPELRQALDPDCPAGGWPREVAPPPEASVGQLAEVRGPGYWMWETGGVLRPAVEAYLNGAELTAEQIAAMRAYCRQWIMSPVWDKNPHAEAEEKAELAGLRADIDGLTDQTAIEAWIERAVDAMLDPL